MLEAVNEEAKSVELGLCRLSFLYIGLMLIQNCNQVKAEAIACLTPSQLLYPILKPCTLLISINKIKLSCYPFKKLSISHKEYFPK
ncbi:hypothetical protein ACE6H2_009317 [Prunus campanulata]